MRIHANKFAWYPKGRSGAKWYVGGHTVACLLLAAYKFRAQCLLTGGFSPQFFPKLEGIVSLFSRGITAASLWVHLLAINLFSARTTLRDGVGTLSRPCAMRVTCSAPSMLVCACLNINLLRGDQEACSAEWLSITPSFSG